MPTKVLMSALALLQEVFMNPFAMQLTHHVITQFVPIVFKHLTSPHKIIKQIADACLQAFVNMNL